LSPRPSLGWRGLSSNEAPRCPQVLLPTPCRWPPTADVIHWLRRVPEMALRGGDHRMGELFWYVELEARVRRYHPVRAIRTIVMTRCRRSGANLQGLFADWAAVDLLEKLPRGDAVAGALSVPRNGFPCSSAVSSETHLEVVAAQGAGAVRYP
jgi:hypothetical protein